MYISKISAQNFGTIGDKTVNLQDGLIVVRGRNGAGKSTLMRQVPMYAFFGASTLDAPITDTVKTGEKALKVEVVYGPYTVTRSKSSASVTGSGIQISGQAEVSDFFYNLFGIQKGVAEDILVANQGDTAGIISRRKGDITSFIESVAGFSQIDELIEKARVKFPCSNVALLKEMIEKGQEELSSAGKELAEQQGISPTISEQEKEIFIKEAGVGLSKDNIASKEAAITVKRSLLKAAVEKNHSIDLKDAEVLLGRQKSVKLGEEFNSSLEAVNTFTLTDEKEVEAAKEILLSSEKMKKDLAAYQWVTSLIEPDAVWEGELESFDAACRDKEAYLKVKKQRRTEIEFEIKNLRAAVVNEKTCKECGQDITHIHAIINLNNTVKIKDLEVELAAINEEVVGLSSDLNTLASISILHNKLYAAYIKHGESYFSVNKSTVPFVYSWAKVSVPQPIDDARVIEAATTVTSAKKAVEALELLVKARDRKRKELEEHVATAILSSRQRKDMGDKVPVLEMENSIADITNIVAALRSKLSEEETLLSEMKKTLAVRVESISNLIKSVNGKQEELLRLKGKLKDEERSSKLIKNMRDSKPIVLDKVWSTILDNTSFTYSNILGQEVKINKDEKGFRINGLPVPRLSGSEQSVLGIVMRSIIRDVFAPQAGFIILDEPTSDMDEERTFAIMGALQMLNGQRIVITHSDLLESFADQVLEIS